MTAPAEQTPRAELARAAVRLMAALVGLCGDPVEIEVRCNGTRTVVVVSAEEQAAILGPPKVEGLSPLEEAIYAVLTDRPQPAKVLARLAGYRLNPHFRGGLRALQRRAPPLCVKVAEGYRRP